MTLNELKQHTGGLSFPSKMPCPAWGLSAFDCLRGSKLADLTHTACSICYARRGRYRFPNVQTAYKRRLEAYNANPNKWAEAMIQLIPLHADKHFRWFDSGDLQSVEMFSYIIDIAKALPYIKFWLPTQESTFIDSLQAPKNLCVRLSAVLIEVDEPLNQSRSMIIDASDEEWDALVKTSTKQKWHCPVENHMNRNCGSCRACWNKNVELIVYKRNKVL